MRFSTYKEHYKKQYAQIPIMLGQLGIIIIDCRHHGRAP